MKIKIIVFVSVLLVAVCLGHSQWVQTDGPSGGTVNTITVSGTSLFAGNNGVFLSTNNGISWNSVDSGLSISYVRCLAVNGTNIFAGGNFSVCLSTNNGTSWKPVFSDLINCIAISDSSIFAGCLPGNVWLSTNNGTSWTPLGTGIYLPIYGVSSLVVKDTNLFAGGFFADGGDWGGVFLLSDNGKRWKQVDSGLTNLNVSSLVVNGSNLFAGTWSGIFRSTNDGTSWTAVNSGLANTVVNSLAMSGSNLFAGTEGGVFLSTNDGISWTAVNSGLTNTNIKCLAVSGTNLFAGNIVVCRRPLSEMIPTSVEQSRNILPSKFSLDQNYPNPFNPTTQINYALAKASYVTLKIYNVLGQQITTIVNGKNEPGEHSVTWNALNVPSGVYFYRISAGDFVQTKKMVLMK